MNSRPFFMSRLRPRSLRNPRITHLHAYETAEAIISSLLTRGIARSAIGGGVALIFPTEPSPSLSGIPFSDAAHDTTVPISGLRMNHSALALFAQRTRIPTSARSIGFCVIWICISSSTSIEAINASSATGIPNLVR